MPIPMTDLRQLLDTAFPEAQITIEDTMGDQDHYHVEVVSDLFTGKSRVAQHQMVYAALQGGMDTRLHAMSLTTRTP